jgi:hypothetical protein
MRQAMRKTQRGLVEDDRSHPYVPTPPPNRARRAVVVMTRRAAFGAAWLATVSLAAFVGWLVGQRFTPPEINGSVPPPSLSAAERPIEQGITEGQATSPRGLEDVRPPGGATNATPEPAVELVLEELTATEPPAIEQATQPATSGTAAISDIPSEPPVVEPVEFMELVGPAVPAVVITEGFERAAGLAESGDYEGARAEAEVLLTEYGDYSGLIGAFGESGAADTRARLNALRVLQHGGLQMISVELARELKRSYAGSAEVVEAIHDWRILKPSIAKVDTSIEEGIGVVVRGRVANPDIGVVRRVIVEVEAFDAGGDVVAKITARVRPRSLDSGAAGSFTVQFTEIDPASVFRTRATVVEWQSEVFEQ